MIVAIIATGTMFTFSSAYAAKTAPLGDAGVVINPGSTTLKLCKTNQCYNPQVVTIGVGHLVSWTNADGFTHTLKSGSPGVSGAGSLFSITIAPKGTYSQTFSQAGTFSYFDPVYPWMTGKVYVK